MRGMQRLAQLTQTAVADLDAKADAVADRIVNAPTRANEAIGKFGAFAGQIGRTADDVRAALGQISNDPTAADRGRRRSHLTPRCLAAWRPSCLLAREREP